MWHRGAEEASHRAERGHFVIAFATKQQMLFKPVGFVLLECAENEA